MCERKIGEDFKAYQERRKNENSAGKRAGLGHIVWDSFRQGTYSANASKRTPYNKAKLAKAAPASPGN
jgi:hypothetical protein